MLAVQLACSPAFTCFKYGDVLVINPNSQIILDGSCTSGCESAASTGVSYAWRLYAAVRTGSKITWSPIVMPNNSFVSGQEKNKIVLLPSFFAAYQEISFQWKVALEISTSSRQNGQSSGFSSLVLAINQLPVNGSCSVWPTNGTAMLTEFDVSCSGWVDPDGGIQKYEFYASYLNVENSIPVGLGYNSIGSMASLRLQEGTLKVWVRVKDVAGGSVDYTIEQVVCVEANEDIMDELMSWEFDVGEWFAGSTQDILKMATAVVQTLNSVDSSLNSSNATVDSLNSTSRFSKFV